VTGPQPPAHNPPFASPASDLAAAAKADLLGVLPDLSAWRLDRDRWTRIERILSELTAALARADDGALHRATTELERASPMLVHLIGATKAVPAPEPLRNQASRLIDSLRDAYPRSKGSGAVAAGPPTVTDGHPGNPARRAVAGRGEGGAPDPR
jgi:hypothetical protein